MTRQEAAVALGFLADEAPEYEEAIELARNVLLYGKVTRPMTQAEALAHLEWLSGIGEVVDNVVLSPGKDLEALDIAIAALREVLNHD